MRLDKPVYLPERVKRVPLWRDTLCLALVGVMVIAILVSLLALATP
jgi:hypothetical protein